MDGLTLAAVVVERWPPTRIMVTSGTRSYRVQEGHQFNQRVVQFILDPESAGSGRPSDEGLRRLWLSLHESVDEVTRVETIKEGRSDE